MGVARSLLTRSRPMSLVFSCSPASLLLMMADTADSAAAPAPAEFDTLDLRNRSVTETLSKVEDFGQNQENGHEKTEEEPDAKKAKFDTLALRNRDVTETLSPLEN